MSVIVIDADKALKLSQTAVNLADVMAKLHSIRADLKGEFGDETYKAPLYHTTEAMDSIAKAIELIAHSASITSTESEDI